MKSLRILIAFFLLLTSCSLDEMPHPTESGSRTISTIQPTKTKISHRTSTVTRSTETSLSSDLQKRCPATPELSLDQLGLESNYVFILGGGDGLWLYQVAEKSFRNIPLQARHPLLSNERFQVSPDSKWFAYFAESEHDPVNTMDLWITSLDGLQTWKMDFSFLKTSSIHWDEPDILSVWKKRDTRTACPRPAYEIHPFEAEIEEYQPVFLESGRYMCENIPGTRWISPDYSKYVAFYHGWKLLEYPGGSTKDIFPWLPSTGMATPFDLFLQVTQRGVNILQPDSEGVNIALDVPFDSLSDDKVAFSRIRLPIPRLKERIEWWSEDGRLIAIDSNFEGGAANPEFNGLMVFDARDNVVYDYCLSRSNASAIQNSPDQGYIAWTEFDDLKLQPKSLVILDINTGYYSRIPCSYELLDWIVTDSVENFDEN